jgi:hypothetical protein
MASGHNARYDRDFLGVRPKRGHCRGALPSEADRTFTLALLE